MGQIGSHDYFSDAYSSMAGYCFPNQYPYYGDREREYYENRWRNSYGDRARETYYSPPVSYYDPYNTYRQDYAPVTFPDPYSYRREYGAPLTYHDPYNSNYRRDYGAYDNYRRDYGSRNPSKDRYGVVPQEEVYRRDEYAPSRHDGYHDKEGHDNYRRERRTVELYVPMCCENCERRVKSHLRNMEGAESVTTDQWTKKVVVVGYVKPEFALSRAQRDRPGSEYWSTRRRTH